MKVYRIVVVERPIRIDIRMNSNAVIRISNAFIRISIFEFESTKNRVFECIQIRIFEICEHTKPPGYSNKLRKHKYSLQQESDHKMRKKNITVKNYGEKAGNAFRVAEMF